MIAISVLLRGQSGCLGLCIKMSSCLVLDVHRPTKNNNVTRNLIHLVCFNNKGTEGLLIHKSTYISQSLGLLFSSIAYESTVRLGCSALSESTSLMEPRGISDGPSCMRG